MGPPSLSTATSSSSLGCVQRRSTRTALFTTTNDPSAAKQQQHFPRRWPGIGSSFQCKVLPAFKSRSGYTSDRRAPDPMSLEYPHRTRTEVETNIVTSSEDQGIESNALEPIGYETKRGGLLRHSIQPMGPGGPAPSAKPLEKTISSSSELSSSVGSLREWTERMCSWHAQHRRDECAESSDLPLQRKTNSRYKKRPISDISKSDVVSLPLQRAGPFVSFTSSKKKCSSASCGAPQISMVNYFLPACEGHKSLIREDPWVNYAGNNPQAILSCLAQWTGSRSRRSMQRRLKQCVNDTESFATELSKPCTTISLISDERKADPTWRERIACSTIVTSSGDFRNFSNARSYSFLELLDPVDNDELKEIWSAVRCCAELLLQKLQCRQSHQKPVYLSEVWYFLFYASHLPVCRDSIIAATEQESLSKVMEGLIDAYSAVRISYARLLDLWGESGVDPDAILKEIEASVTSNSISIDCLSEMKQHIHVVFTWQKNVDSVFASCNTSDGFHQRNDLEALEKLLVEGRGHGIRSKGLVSLEQKVERAYHLQKRIILWKKSSANVKSRETIKFTSALVRDIHRLKIRTPVVNEMLLFHQDAESWVERANIAIRSRISLDEIKSLVHRGRETPLDLSEYLEKLQSRIATATDWLERFFEVIPYPKSLDDPLDHYELIRLIRAELDDSCGRHNILHDLSMEGSRIPVEIDIVKVLHVELEARAWVLKTKKWLPSYDGKDEVSRRGKLDDLREHTAKAKSLRGRVCLPSSEKLEWLLEGETELLDLVDAADDWLEEYQPYLDGTADDCISIEQLRRIVEKGNSIFVNLGSEATKFSRFLVQAESWYEQHFSLFIRCNLRNGPCHDKYSSVVQLNELKDAIAVAESDFPIMFSEALELQTLVEKVEDWMFRASRLRMKRRSKKMSQNLSLEDLVLLINEAKALPVDTCLEVAMLKEKYQAIQDWHIHSVKDLEKICSGFSSFREAINMSLGPSNDYKLVPCGSSNDIDDPFPVDSTKVAIDLEIIDSKDSDDSTEESSASQDVCSAVVSLSNEASQKLAKLGCGDCDIYMLIQSFSSSSHVTSCIVTQETEIADLLKSVIRWCIRSLIYLETQHIIFDKRCFASFDRFLLEGKRLLEDGNYSKSGCHYDGDSDLLDRLSVEWRMIVTDQLARLSILVSSRDRYLSWCKKVEQHLNSDDRRPTLDKINEFAQLSHQFPSSCDLVRKVQSLASRCNDWVRSVRSAIAGPEKMSFSEANAFYDEAEKLCLSCNEIKTLRNGLKAARSWISRMKRSKSREGEWDQGDAQALIDEHDTLMISMTEEAKVLRGALKRYCLCRRTMDGFMIACDECNDWFHGSCVGISKKRAVDRVARYVCVRCSIAKTYKSCALLCVNVIRKWLSPKEMKKVRQVENQKHKRKVRKENKDMEALRAEILSLRGLYDSCSRTCQERSMMPHCGNNVSHGSSPPVDTSPTYDLVSNDSTTQNLSGRVELQTLSVSVVSESENDVALSTCTCASVDDNTEVSPNDSEIIDISRSKEYGTEDILCSDANMRDVEATGTTTRDGESAMELSSEPALSSECTNSKEVAFYPADGLVVSTVELLLKIEKLQMAVEASRLRVLEFEEQAKRQISMDKEEMKMATQFRMWALRVRSLVLVPSKSQLASMSKPHRGIVSSLMDLVAKDAERLGIQDTNDVKTVLNSFHSMSWCLHAISIFSRQPTANGINSLVQQSSSIDFPDEKAVRAIKAIAQRIAGWESKVERALTPIPGITEPFNLESLKSLMSQAEDIPVCIPVEQRLANVIEDRGMRHCLCGGPSDGRFMLSCDQCDRWFHGHCVAENPKFAESDANEWKCPSCRGQSIDLDLERFHDKFDAIEEDDESIDVPDEDSGELLKAPDPAKLWPPFGLFGSPEAMIVLGEEVCAIPDCIDMELDYNVPLVPVMEDVTAGLPSSGNSHRSLSECVSDVASVDERNTQVESKVMVSSPPMCVSSSLTSTVDNVGLVPTSNLVLGTSLVELQPLVVSNTAVPPSVPMDIESNVIIDAAPSMCDIQENDVKSIEFHDEPQITSDICDETLVGVELDSEHKF